MAFHLNGYSNFHDDNQDWIVSKIKNIDNAEAHTEELAEAAQASADASQASAEASQLSAEASQTSAEASQQSAENAAESETNAAQSELSAKNYADHIADPVSGLVTTWLSDHITNPSNPPIDTSLTVAGAAADAKAAGDEITDLKIVTNEYIKGLNKTYTVSQTGPFKVNALLLKNTKYTYTNNTDAQCTLRVYNNDGTNILITSNLPAGSSISFYIPNDIAVSVGGYMSGTGTVSLETDYSNFNDYRLVEMMNYSTLLTWELGSIYGNNGENYDDMTQALRTPSASKVYIGTTLHVLSLNSLIEKVYAFKYDENGTYIERLGNVGSWDVILDAGYYYRIVIIAKQGTVITDETMSLYSTNTYLCAEMLSKFLHDYDEHITYITGYSIGPNMLKTDIRLDQVGNGSLKYGQSFLIYNDKYYSTDGEHIAVQSEDFTVEQDVALSVGHGNSFCLGVSNKGYISGWDDNKIYVVNLDTLSIHTIIDLPTTGYTTCAIDEANGVAYIFQRDTQPNTESKYNVIAYDYINETVLYTNETAKAFGAMQSCDYYNDKIIVLNGLGTTILPNGYRVYNTKGEILTDYIIPDFETIEPEGVFFNKVTGELYMSLVNAKVYKISIA